VAVVILALSHDRGIILGLAIIGFVHGGMMNGVPYCVVRYFGVKFFAGIFGLISVLLGLSSFGALLFSHLRDISNSYEASLFVSGGVLIGAAALLARLGFHPYFTGASPKGE